MVAARTAVLLRDGQPEEAQVAEAFDDRPVDRLAPVPLGGVRGDLGGDELGGEGTARFVLG